jgi:hypothetical protein
MRVFYTACSEQSRVQGTVQSTFDAHGRSPEQNMENIMEFYKDGKVVELAGLFERGEVGQIVVLVDVNYPGYSPFAEYPQPSFFVIDDKKEGGYVLRDVQGNLIELPFDGVATWFFYLADEWARWTREREIEELRKKDGYIKSLRHDIDLLKGILIAQGFRVIAESQAKQLGIQS